MKKILNKFLVLFGILALVSCLDDKGNYEYDDVSANKISIRLSSSTSSAYLGEAITFSPSLVIANPERADTNVFKWEYYFNGYGLVCTTRYMNHVFEDAKVGTVEGILRALDTTTGQSYTYNLSFKYLNPYNQGWLLLLKDGNKSKLNLVKKLNDEWRMDNDLTRLLHNVDLGTNPQKLVYNYTTYRNEVRIFQDQDVILEGDNYEQVGTFEEEFFGNKYPEGFEPSYVTTTGGKVSAILGTNGDVYTKIFYDKTTYPSERWMERVLQDNGRKLNVQHLISGIPLSSSVYNLLVYDRDSSSFYLIGGNGFNANTGSLFRLDPPEGWSADSSFAPSPRDLSEYDVLYCALRYPSSTNMNLFTILRKKTSNEYFFYGFEYRSNSYNTEVSNMYYKKVPDGVAGMLGDGAMYRVTKGTRVSDPIYLFIVPSSERKSLYYCNVLLPSPELILYENFQEDITALNMNYNTDTELGVGLANNNFYVLNVTRELLTGSSNEDKIICEINVGATIVDCCWKQN